MKQAKPHLTIVPAQLGRQRGASLLEGIAYLGIAALVVLGAVSLLTNAFGSAKGNQTTEEVVAMRTAVRKLFAGQAYTNGAILGNLLTANAIPNTLVRVANGGVNNSWAGAVTVTGNGTSQFTITYNNVPQDVCMSVVSGANGWTSISNANGAKAINAFPVTTDNAATVCGAANNVLEFTAT